MANRPSKINIYNVKYFFDTKTISPSGIIPGMLIEFNYRSPEGVHDKKPLVYVLEVQADRVYGINIHYNFNLITQLLGDKQKEIASLKIETPEIPATDEELKSKKLPGLPEVKKVLPVKTITSLKDRVAAHKGVDKPNGPSAKTNIKIPQKLLEHFDLNTFPENILRNYLYPRMSGISKFIYKPE